MHGRVFNIQRYSTHDGPGIRTTVFLKGCPLHCAWCHNPESQDPHQEILMLEDRCISCGTCQEVCEFDANLHGDSCVRCGGCADACPADARRRVGRDMTPEQLTLELLKDRVFFEESHGGITFGGGEPLMQTPFLHAMLDRLEREDISVALDTCGYAPQANLLSVAGRCRVVLFDLKLLDDARHRQWTGVPSGPIIENFKALGARHNGIWVRIPLVPGVNDAPEDLEAMADLAASVPGVQQVNLLPYHRIGVSKFSRAGRHYTLPEVVPPSHEQMESLANLFRDRGLTTKVGG